jgi:hypothetical protein
MYTTLPIRSSSNINSFPDGRPENSSYLTHAVSAYFLNPNAEPFPSQVRVRGGGNGDDNYKTTKKSKKGRRNIAAEFNNYFGSEYNLANWQRLCRDLGVQEGSSITQCKKASIFASPSFISSLKATQD